MSMKTVPEKYRELLKRHAEEHLLPAAGRWRREMNINRATAGWPAAYLATVDLGFEGLYGSRELLDFAVACGDHFYRTFVRDGRTSRPPEHFSTTFFVDLYGQMRDLLTPARRRRWEEAVLTHCQALADTIQIKFSAPTSGRTALEIGCGPNHVYLWCAMLYRGGMVLGRPDFRRLASWAMGKLLEGQHPEGYHPEHRGPVLQYHTITSSGLATYYDLSRDPRCLEPLRRAAGFYCRTIYPDLSPIEVFDERSRWHPNYAFGAHGSLCQIPMGRRYIDLALDRMLNRKRRDDHRGGVGIGWLLRGLLNYQDGPHRPLPCENPEMLVRLDRAGLIRRTGPWFHALSAFCNEPWEYNPYILDRIQHLSCWHEKTGLIVGGGNDKGVPEMATFYSVENGEVGYYRPRRGRIVAGREGDRVELDYGPIRAALTLRVVDGSRVQLTADLNHWVLYLKPTFNLELQLAAGEQVTLAAGRTVRLPRATSAARNYPTGGLLRTDRWELRGPADMRLRWPHVPHKVRAHQRRHVDGAVGILTVPFPDAGGRLEVQLRVL